MGRRVPLETVLERVALAHSKKVAEAIVNEIRNNPETPVEQGYLRNSYRVEFDQARNRYVVVAGVRYWKYVEFGTGRGPEQPHVRPAIDLIRARGRG